MNAPTRIDASSAATGALCNAFARDGVAGPVDLLSATDCAALHAHLHRDGLPAPLDWHKGRAATDRVIYEIAASAEILALVKPLLGEDIVLWGAQRVLRKPGTAHNWHCDLESAAPDGRFATVWIGVHHTSAQSGMIFIEGSQRYGKTIQQAAAESGVRDLDDAKVLSLARAIDPQAQLVRREIGDGQAMVFDGRTWHTGRNDGASGVRVALLLQYAAADMVLRMPAREDYRWPFKFGPAGRLPAILVSGRDSAGVNRLVPPPAPLQKKEAPMITTRAQTVELPLAENAQTRWQIYRQFRGPTRTFQSMSCHISVLSAGYTPHPPHIHPEEEMLIVLDGEVEISLATHPEDPSPRKLRLRPGMFSYYPSTQHHTISNPGTAPVTYLMFKWLAGEANSANPLQASVFTYGDPPPPGAPAFHKKLIFEQATDRLGKLHAHFTTLQPGAGYAPHVDAYDVAILVLSGEVETLGTRVKPLGIVYYSGGETHGMRNVGAVPATYLVIEFHSPAVVALKEEARRQAQARKAAAKAARKAARRRNPLARLVRLVRRLFSS